MDDEAISETTNLPALPDDPGQFLLYQTEDGQTRVEVRIFRETVWLSQKAMAELFQKDVRTINEHICNVFSEGELHGPAVVRKFRITASDGKQYDTLHYNLDVIISVGCRVKSHRGTQFRIWATQHLRERIRHHFVLSWLCGWLMAVVKASSCESPNPKHLDILAQGVDAWNKWRHENPDVPPDLRGAMLRETDLNGADLSGADLSRANLEGAILKRANLKNADLREADLRKVDFTEAKLDDALLRDASLRNACLKDALCLNASQLGATDLTGASLPQDIQNFDRVLDLATQASKSAHGLFITLMIACFYCLITIGATTDALLFDDSASTNLPIIQAPVPFTRFYLVAPGLLLCLYVYMHLYLQRLWEALAGLPALLPDGRQLSDRVSPWLLGGLIFRYFPRLKVHGRRFILLQTHLSVFLAWLATPLIAILFWFRYLPKHAWAGTAIHVILSALLIAFAYLFYNEMAETLRGVRAKRGGARLLEVLAPFVVFAIVMFLMLFHLSYMQIEGAHPRPAILSGAELSKKPPNWDPADPNQAGVKRARLARADLRCAIADAAFLARADLLEADMRDAHLWRADLRKAFLVRTILSRAILLEADLRGAQLDGAHLVEAKLGDARLSHAELTGADLTGALLAGANLCRANLFRARLDGAQMSHQDYIRLGPTWNVLEFGTDFTEAILNKASLRGANLHDANLTGANLSEANLSNANLSNANLSNANLNKAILRGADLSGVRITDTTDFNDVRVDPNTSFAGVELTDKHRQQIWGPNGVPDGFLGKPRRTTD